MKPIFLLIAFAFSTHLVFAQISVESVDTATAHRLLREGTGLLLNNQSKPALKRLKLSLELLSAAPPDKYTIQCLSDICVCHANLSELDSLKFYAERGMQLSKALLEAGTPPTEDFSRHKALYYRFLQQYSAAIDWQSRSLAYTLEYFPQKTNLVADAYNDLGVLYMDNGQFDSSMVLIHEMLRLRRSIIQDNRSNQLAIARGLQNIGILHKESGRFDAAIEMYEQALKICIAQHDEDLEARVWYNMGFAIELQGEIERAFEHYQKSGDIFLKLYGEKHPLYAVALNKMANMLTVMDEKQTAWALHQKVLAINLSKFGLNHPKVAISKYNLSNILSKLERKEEAVNMAREAVDILERNFLEAHPQKISAYINLVICYFEAGIHEDSVLYFLNKCEIDCRKVYGNRSENTANLLARKSVVLDNPAHRTAALKTIQEAIIAASRTFDSQDVHQNPEPDDFFQADGGIIKMHDKALILAGMYEDFHRREDLDLTLASLEHGNAIMQTKLRKIGDKGTSDYQLNDSWGLLCKDAIKISALYQKEFAAPENMERCFRWMERDKAQKLLLSTKNAQAKTFAGIPDSLLLHDAQLAQQLTSLEQQLRNAEENKDSVTILQLRNEAIFSAKANRNAFVRNLERDFPAYFALKYQNSTVELNKIQGQLPPETLLLELAFGNSSTDSTLYLLAVSKSSKILLQQPLQNGLFGKIERLNSLLQNQSLVQAAKRKEFAKISSELYAQFIQPIEKQLIGVKKIIFIGDGITQLLPFEVLLPTKDDKPFGQMDFLIKHFEISYHYSATLWANTSPAEDNYKLDLFAFAPVFEHRKSDNTKPGLSLTSTRDSSIRAISADGKWAPLPWTEKEVQNITQIFQAKKQDKIVLLLREQADENNLKLGLERGARCIHLASHSFANVKQPKFSGIACSNNPAYESDGTLVVGELYNLNIPASLVVLSSCESGKGKLLQGEGQLGLNRAFLYAGVPNVLFSLWKVNDQATSDFMSHFYRAMLQGQSYAAALRAAKLKLLADPVTASPNLWSDFLLIGK